MSQFSDVQSHHVSVDEVEPAGDTADVDTGEGGQDSFCFLSVLVTMCFFRPIRTLRRQQRRTR
jgi:hypothetical protein